MAYENDRFGTFTGLIQQIEKSILRIKTYKMAEYGLKGIHAICLYHLGMNPNGLTSAQLSQKSGEDKGSISRAIAVLRERGLIEDDKDSGENRYRRKISLTEDGRKMAEEIEKKASNVLEEVSREITEQERKTLYLVLGKIENNLEEMIQKMDM